MKNYILKGIVLVTICLSCKQNSTDQPSQTVVEETTKSTKQSDTTAPFFKLSLAQWSLHKAFENGTLDPIDFAENAKELGFEGVEYVTQLYTEHLKKYPDPERSMRILLDTLKSKSEQHNIQNVLIMVDGEGDLGVADQKERDLAVENHKKWVDAAAFLGCHAIRVNVFGSTDPEEWVRVSTDALQKLSQYAATKNVNILVENHGWLSSDSKLLAEVMEKVAMPNCGTLPDFGNFCTKRQDGERWGTCVQEYPKYQGVQEMMPYAKAVSAKSYDFDDSGNETTIDYKRMLAIVKEAGYTGFIGVEYEGDRLSEEEGTTATRELLLTAANQLQ